MSRPCEDLRHPLSLRNIGWESSDEAPASGPDAGHDASLRRDTHRHNRRVLCGAPDRAGNYVVSGLNWQSAGKVHRHPMFDGRVEGYVYA
jgi:hypothetical protein